MPIWNRESILELFSRELARSSSSGNTLTVILVRVDDHAESQNPLVLGEIAKRLSARLRPYDYMGGYGPGQFLILLPEWDPASAFPLAEKLRTSLVDKPVEIPGSRVRITISLAAANSVDFGLRGKNDVLRELEAALEGIQASGGNRAELLSSNASSGVRRIAKRRRIRISWAVAVVLVVGVAALLFLAPSWSCAPNLTTDIFDSGELPPPLPPDCILTTDKVSEATMQTLEKEREADELELQGIVTCKMASASSSGARSGNIRDQQWLGTLYTDGRLQYRRHVLIATSEDVPGGKLFTVEQCLMPWWKYIVQWKQYCRTQDLPWE